jgi:threonine dehydratase
MSLRTIPTKEDIIEAHKSIRAYIERTPVLTSESINNIAGCKIFFKSENFQKVGAFKARGAMNAVLALSDEERSRGVATHSLGNHAQAVARAAKLMGIRSYIVMPSTVSAIKAKGVVSFGGEIFSCEPTQESREKTLAEVVQKTGAIPIHPFNNYDVMAGQATAAKELFEEISNLDFMVVPVGGGGLLSGTLLAAKYFSPETRVIAGEPEGADDTYRSMQSGKREISQGNSIADGLLTSVGDMTFPIIHEHVKEVIPVSDSEIVSAMRLVWERLKLIIEPSAAVPFAAVLKKKELFLNHRVGIIISGGNVDLEKISQIFT